MSEPNSVIAEILDRVLARAVQDDAPSFRALVEAAGLKPEQDFVCASLRNIDLRDQDLRGFNFSYADLAGATSVEHMSKVYPLSALI